MGLGNSENDLIVDDCDGEGAGIADDGGEVGGGGYGKSLGSVSCSICLEVVMDTGDRSWAKLQCGHQFHLDCIGSAFNTKGVMQCPNCRKVEKGQWLFANGSRSLPEVNTDDWAHEEDAYYSISQVSLGFHYCPFGGSLTRPPSSFEEGELSLNAYHDLLGQPAVFAEHAAAISSASNACPYIAYFGPIHPSSSSSSAGVSDTSNFNGHWNAPSVPSDMASSYGFPAALDLHYHSWEHQSPPFSTTSSRIGGVDQSSLPPNAQRAVGRSNNVGPQRAGSFMHPFVINPGSGARAGSSVPPSGTPTYQGSNARARDRVQALQDYYQQQPGSSPPIHAPPLIATSARRPSSSSHRGLSRVIPPTPDQAGFYFFPSAGTTSSGRNYQEPENASSRTGFRAWEPLFPLNNSHPDRDSGWGPTYQQGSGGSEAGGGIRSGSFRQRQNRS
ncbi:unnamed protein product [Linum tenue]|uniref:RING-type domain-containing protein n=1 Tax=Linum tenue TaxID=586396 RepID=A0AAV0NMP6_9ROSI|nr:unnamed protein product [Linum tenue]